MDPNDDCRNTAGEGRSVAALTLVMGILFITYFGLRTAMPELPLHVYQALAAMPYPPNATDGGLALAGS